MLSLFLVLPTWQIRSPRLPQFTDWAFLNVLEFAEEHRCSLASALTVSCLSSLYTEKGICKRHQTMGGDSVETKRMNGALDKTRAHS